MTEAEAGPATLVWPVPESDDLGRYLEDTITIDWQTPIVSERATALLAGCDTPEARVEALFRFVRDEIADAVETPDAPLACSASQVLHAGAGLDYAKSHLLAALLRFAGVPTGFCYARLVDPEHPGRFVLRGSNAIWWAPGACWVPLDASDGRGAAAVSVRFAPPWQLPTLPDPGRGEGFLPAILRRPPRRIIDLLERAPDLAAALRGRPDGL